MSRRRPYIPLRRPIFVGCEGQSEAGYAALLRDLARDAGLPIHLAIHDLGRGAGDPFARVDLAVGILKRVQQTRQAPADRFILLDSDQARADPRRAERARQLADQHQIRIIWQDPCFEAVLLRHLDGHATRRPIETRTAEQQLAREWEGYAKGLSAAQLARHIDLAAVFRAAEVEADLRALLVCLGLVPQE